MEAFLLKELEEIFSSGSAPKTNLESCLDLIQRSELVPYQKAAIFDANYNLLAFQGEPPLPKISPLSLQRCLTAQEIIIEDCLEEKAGCGLYCPLFFKGEQQGWLYFSRQDGSYTGEHCQKIAPVLFYISTEINYASLKDSVDSKGGMIHDLRNALVVVKGYLGLLSEQPNPSEMLDKVRKKADWMTQIIQSELPLSQIERGNFNKQAVDLGIWVKGHALDYQEKMEIELVNYSVEAQPLMGYVNLNPNLMGRVLGNLLSNAIKFMGKDREVRVETGIKEEEDSVMHTFSVTDSGPGIAPQDLSKLFHFGYTASQGDVQNRNGQGLGLAVSWSIVRGHGGRILVSSKKGEGTKFTVALPPVVSKSAVSC